jgi:predicted ATP-dependent endonuclease of OLD family
MVQITKIFLDDGFSNYLDCNFSQLKELSPLSKINIFVGANNSGKSRFTRLLAKIQEYQVDYENSKISEFAVKHPILLTEIINLYTQYQLDNVENIQKGFLQSTSSLPVSISLRRDSLESIRQLYEKLSTMNHIRNYSGPHQFPIPTMQEVMMKNGSAGLELLSTIPTKSDYEQYKKIYIPTLRGMRPVIENDYTDYYESKTRSDYFSPENNEQVTIFSGLNFFTTLTQMLLGDRDQRNAIANYESFLSEYLFEGEQVELIPSIKTSKIVVKIGKEKEKEIHNLGDGIQSAIILTFLPFVTSNPSFFFIEEPELYLHPGLQRKIMSFFEENTDHIFFLTTHSNHFLDLSIDYQGISIFLFRKDLNKTRSSEKEDELTPKFIIEPLTSGDRSALELLGVRNSSMFLVNATIWVEGITDRWYLRQMLESYITQERKKKIEEDLHYSFVEYGGANITHFSFLDFEKHPINVENLCAKAIVVIDTDGDSKEARKAALSEKLGERLIKIPGREIENLLPFTVIKKVILEYEDNSGTTINDFRFSEYQDEHLGTFINSKVLNNKYSRKGGYAADSGTIIAKVEFCKKALDHIIYSDLDSSVQNVIKQIYDFIIAQNQ